MSKVYKGYELLKAIADREIKEGSKFIIKYGEFNDFYVFYKNGEIKTALFGKEYKLTTKDFTESKFELIEDEIDIDNIEEMKLDGVDDIIYYVNDLIKAVKQLDRKIKEK